MFTIIEDEIYKIDGEKLRKVIIKDGQLKIAKESVKHGYNEIYTLNEIKKMFNNLFIVEQTEQPVIEEKPQIINNEETSNDEEKSEKETSNEEPEKVEEKDEETSNE